MRVGVIVLFFGVAFLLKFASEHIEIPIEARLIGVAIGALVMLAIGWRLRLSRPGYGLILQGGAIGVLYLTVFAAFRLYQLLPGGLVLRAAGGDGGFLRDAGGVAGFALACGCGRQRRLSRADPGFHRRRQPRHAVQFLRAAQSRHSRHRLVQSLARR